MAEYRKKPVVIEAVQFPFSDPLPDWLTFALIAEPGKPGSAWMESDHRSLNIGTLEGVHIASPGDFIIRGVKGELYPCKPDIFAATYDAVEAR